MKIIILALDDYGDLTLRQSFVAAWLKQGAKATLVVRTETSALIPYLDHGSRVLTTSNHPSDLLSDKDLKAAHQLLAQIQESHPDRIIAASCRRGPLEDWLLTQLQNLPRYGFDLNSATQDPAKIELYQKLGIPLKTHQLLSHWVFCDGSLPDFEKYALLFRKAAGVDVIPQVLGDGYLPKLCIPEDQVRETQEFLATLGVQEQNFVLVTPNDFGRNTLKSWPETSLSEVLCQIHQNYSCDILLTGLKGQEEYLKRIKTRCAEKNVNIKNWVGHEGDVAPLISLSNLCRFYLGVDSAVMHFASALGKPVVALYGGGTPLHRLPTGKRIFITSYRPLCADCNWDCWLSKPACLSLMPTQQVTQGVEWILSESPDQVRIEVPESHELKQRTLQVFKDELQGKQKTVSQLESQLQISNQEVEQLRTTLQSTVRFQQEILAESSILKESHGKIEKELTGLRLSKTNLETELYATRKARVMLEFKLFDQETEAKELRTTLHRIEHTQQDYDSKVTTLLDQREQARAQLARVSQERLELETLLFDREQQLEEMSTLKSAVKILVSPLFPRKD